MASSINNNPGLTPPSSPEHREEEERSPYRSPPKRARTLPFNSPEPFFSSPSMSPAASGGLPRSLSSLSSFDPSLAQLPPFTSPASSSASTTRPLAQPLTPLAHRVVPVRPLPHLPFPFTPPPSHSASLPMPRLPSSSSSSAAPDSFSLSHEAADQMRRKQCPAGPSKHRPPRFVRGQEPTHEGFTLKHFTEPSIIRDLELVELRSDGEYKIAWTSPSGKPPLILSVSNEDLIILTFSKTSRDHNYHPREIVRYFDSTVSQYRQIRDHLGPDKCVQIFNAATAKADGYLANEYISLSFEDVLTRLTTRRFTSLDQWESTDLNEDEKTLTDLIAQLKRFFDKSIEHKIDTDLHVGNFRLKSTPTGFSLLLIDFRESITPFEVGLNKSKEIKELKNKLARFFSPEFIDDFFRDTIIKIEALKSIEREAEWLESSIDSDPDLLHLSIEELKAKLASVSSFNFSSKFIEEHLEGTIREIKERRIKELQRAEADSLESRGASSSDPLALDNRSIFFGLGLDDEELEE